MADEKQKPPSQYTHNGKTYTTSKLPTPNLIRWGRGNGYLEAYQNDLIKVSGFADCYSIDDVQGIKFVNQYWGHPFDLAMEGSGLWLFIQTNAVGVNKALEAKENGTELYVEGVLALMDSNFMLEVLTRTLEPLALTNVELEEYLQKLVPYTSDRIHKAKERQMESATLRYKQELELDDEGAAQVRQLVESLKGKKLASAKKTTVKV
jgi:hypothetical protein